jgi:hypothetical protein
MKAPPKIARLTEIDGKLPSLAELRQARGDRGMSTDDQGIHLTKNESAVLFALYEIKRRGEPAPGTVALQRETGLSAVEVEAALRFLRQVGFVTPV